MSFFGAFPVQRSQPDDEAAKSPSIFLKSLALYCNKGKKKSLYLNSFFFNFLLQLVCFWDVLFLDGYTVRTLFSESECNLCNKVFSEHQLSEYILQFLHISGFYIQILYKLHKPQIQ